MRSPADDDGFASHCIRVVIVRFSRSLSLFSSFSSIPNDFVYNVRLCKFSFNHKYYRPFYIANLIQLYIEISALHVLHTLCQPLSFLSVFSHFFHSHSLYYPGPLTILQINVVVHFSLPFWCSLAMTHKYLYIIFFPSARLYIVRSSFSQYKMCTFLYVSEKCVMKRRANIY